MHCPKCGRGQDDDRVECVRCGIIFAKLANASRPRSADQQHRLVQRSAALSFAEEWLLTTEASVNPFHFAGRVLVFGLLALWG